MRAGSIRKADPLLFQGGQEELRVEEFFDEQNNLTLYCGDCLDLLRAMPADSADLVVTSPPYNVGKEYEERIDLGVYLQQQAAVVAECVRALRPTGSMCWQVGNYVEKGAIVPIDAVLYPVFAAAGLKMRNRIVWRFEHGLHCSRRFSGRYEVIMWFTKTDDYFFDLDPVRIPQKYPGKRYFKGPRAGQFSCNPRGKNPGDVWDIPNVKCNHVEKTCHPCQFPVELVERLVLSMTRPGDLVVDPFMGAGTTAVAAIRHGRRAAGAEIVARYCEIALERVRLEHQGRLRTRPMNKPIYVPTGKEKVAQNPFIEAESGRRQGADV
jgi:adenine-specific DNA-methyltransferase